MDSSPFGRLSAELRNHIYELVLTSPRPIALVTVRNHSSTALSTELQRLRKRIGHTKRTGLTATCSTIRRESTRMFYAANSFELTIPIPQIATGRQRLEAFLSTIGWSNAAALRSIIVRIEDVKQEDTDRSFSPFADLPALVDDLRELGARYPNCAIVVKADFMAGAHPEGAWRTVPLEIDVRDPMDGWEKGLEGMRGRRTEDFGWKWNLIEVGLEQCRDEQAKLVAQS
ncbi:hypothetical protein Tdes44962_MAKER05874 [Teratosphaeria destructans]|uniref:Uncharacterized protein n=1 Tax=Teratosphaeria destructans TaxID=418781 RepID=A0A9W7SIT4_9PEZI|nr:hypothetical protein Tdes44962_MAKER05874 [Teratosphaeria destructans]